jgi:hypothetical protein
MGGEVCYQGICSKCMAVKYMVIGTLFVLTLVMSRENRLEALYNLAMVIGVLLVFKGLLIMSQPSGCGHCQPQTEVKKSRK